MPALIVFAAGIASALILLGLGSAMGSLLVAGFVLGFLVRPLLIGAIQNW